MNPWRWFRARPRFQRTVIALIVALPLLYAVDRSEALWLWLMCVLLTLVPLVIVTRVIAPVDGVDAYDSRHPEYNKAFWLELVLMVVLAVVFVAGYRLLG